MVAAGRIHTDLGTVAIVDATLVDIYASIWAHTVGRLP